MQRVVSYLGIAVVIGCASAQPAAAEMIEKSGRFGGMQVTYKVVLPDGYSAARTYPVVLVFTGGPQQLRGAENTRRAAGCTSPGIPTAG